MKASYDPEQELLGNGDENIPYYICEPEQISLIGNTAVSADYTLDKHYILETDIRLTDNATPESIGGACGTAGRLYRFF